jgi:hypothetical protein
MTSGRPHGGEISSSVVVELSTDVVTFLLRNTTTPMLLVGTDLRHEAPSPFAVAAVVSWAVRAVDADPLVLFEQAAALAMLIPCGQAVLGLQLPQMTAAATYAQEGDEGASWRPWLFLSPLSSGGDFSAKFLNSQGSAVALKCVVRPSASQMVTVRLGLPPSASWLTGWVATYESSRGVHQYIDMNNDIDSILRDSAMAREIDLVCLSSEQSSRCVLVLSVALSVDTQVTPRQLLWMARRYITDVSPPGKVLLRRRLPVSSLTVATGGMLPPFDLEVRSVDAAEDSEEVGELLRDTAGLKVLTTDSKKPQRMPLKQQQEPKQKLPSDSDAREKLQEGNMKKTNISTMIMFFGAVLMALCAALLF